MGKVAGICLTSGIYPPEIGGPAKFTTTFSKWIKENSDLSLSVVTLTDNLSSIELIDGVKVVKISRNQNILLRYINTVFAIRKNSSIHVPILANGLFLESALACLLGRRTYFTKVPGDPVWERARNSRSTKLDIEEYQHSKLPFKYQLFRKMFSISLKRSAKVIVPSIQLKNLSFNWGVKPEKVQLVFNSISTAKFIPDATVAKKYDVLSVCRLVPWKGLDEVIKVCSELKLKLAIAGTGPEMENLNKLAKSLSFSVEFLGEVNQESLIRIYQNSNYFVLNSSYEGLPHSLLEARSCGVFSIANVNTGSAEVISHLKDGLLCGNMTGMSILNALNYAIKNPLFCAAAQTLARNRTIDHFDIDINFKKIFDLVTDG